MIACVAGILSNLSMLFVIAAHAAHWVWLYLRSRPAFRAVRPWTLYVLLVALAVSPWLWQLSRAVDWSILFRRPAGMAPLERASGMTWLALPYTFFTFCLGFSMGPSPRELHGSRSLPVFVPHLIWLIPAALFFLWLTFRGLRGQYRRRNAFVLTLSWLVVPLVLTLYVTLRDIKVFNPRYVAVSLPALFLVWTEAFLGFRKPLLRWAAAAVLAAFWGLALRNYYFDPTYDKDDLRGAGAYVAQHWEPGDYLVTAGAATPIHFYVSQYYPSGNFWLGYAADTLRLGRNFEKDLPPEPARVWVVSCRPHWYDPSDNFKRHLMKSYQVLDHKELLGCSVVLIHNPRAAAFEAQPAP